MFDVNPTPQSKGSLLIGLDRLYGEIYQSMEVFSTADFLAPQGEAWSPAGHLRHLSKSLRALTRGMKMPKPVLLVLFGLSWKGSRSFDEVREVYLRALENGAQAGRFSPSQLVPEMPPEQWRQTILECWRMAHTDLVGVMDRWSEGALDRYRLPHPVLGRMTVRELLFFTLYHNRHHALRVVERAALKTPEV